MYGRIGKVYFAKLLWKGRVLMCRSSLLSKVMSSRMHREIKGSIERVI